MGSPPLLYDLVCKIQFYMSKMTISSLLWGHKQEIYVTQFLSIKRIGKRGGEGGGKSVTKRNIRDKMLNEVLKSRENDIC